MAYATNSDLVQEFPNLASFPASGSVKLTSGQIDEFCTRASNYIDASIAGKYQTPINPSSSPNSASLLKEICCWLVYSRIAPILGINTGDSKTSASQGGKSDYKKQADDALVKIQSGKMILTDAVLASSADGTESFTNDNAATTQPPEFTRCGKDW